MARQARSAKYCFNWTYLKNLINNSHILNKLLKNSLPLSDVTERGVPKRHIHRSKKTRATLHAVLSSMAAISAYFENASVATRIYFLPVLVVFSGPINLCIGTATTLVNGHEPVSYETLKFCGSFLQIYIVKVKGP